MAKRADRASTRRRELSAIGYVRGPNAIGSALGTQSRCIEDYCKYRELDLTGIVVGVGTDNVQDDASLPLCERQGGTQLLQILNDERQGHVVVASLDRLFLDTEDCLRAIDDWRAHGITLHIAALAGSPLDSSSAFGRFMLTAFAAFNEYAAACEREREKRGGH